MPSQAAEEQVMPCKGQCLVPLPFQEVTASLGQLLLWLPAGSQQGQAENEEEARRAREQDWEQRLTAATIRTAPLGTDRHQQRYWWFPGAQLVSGSFFFAAAGRHLNPCSGGTCWGCAARHAQALAALLLVLRCSWSLPVSARLPTS